MQGVDGYEDDVVVLIHELDHLLGAAGHIGAQQSGKAAYAVVDVHHIVAHLELVELLERQSHLARAGAVAAEGVLVEAVEYLMVGEDAGAGGGVGKSLVEGVFDRGESDAVAAIFKYYAQALKLAGVVAQYAQAVTLADEAGEIFGDEVEIFVVQALWAAAEVECGVGVRAGLGGGGEGDAAGTRPGVGKCLGVDHVGHRLGVDVAGGYGRGRHLAGGDGAHACHGVVGPSHGYHGVGRHILWQSAAAGARVYVGGDVDAVEARLRELGLDVEGAYRVNLVAEEVEAEGQLARVAEDVEDGASHGKLPRLVYIVDLAEAYLAQPYLQGGEVAGGAALQRYGVAVDVGPRRHALGQCLGVCHHDAQGRVGGYAAQGLGAEYDGGRVGLAVAYVALVSRGHEGDGGLAQQAGEVKEYVSGIVGVGADHQHGGGACGRGDGGQRHGGR